MIIRRRKLISFVALVLIWFWRSLYIESKSTRFFRLRNEIGLVFQIVRIEIYIDYPKRRLPEDILSPTGEPLLSWRVPFSLAKMDKRGRSSSFWKALSSVNTTKPWNDPENDLILHSRPFHLYYPYYLDSETESKTCLLRIREMHKKIRNGTLEEKDQEKPYLVLVDLPYAVPWTKPEDLSWRDLASGKVKLLTLGGAEVWYITATCNTNFRTVIPKTFEEWFDFCGLDD